MNLHDQLKQATKTKEEVYAKEYREGYKNSYDGCGYVVSEIRDEFLKLAENGKYQELSNGKKYIEVRFTDSLLDYNLGLKFNITNKKSKKGKYLGTYIHCKVGNKGKYDGFIKRMNEFAEEDGVSFCIEYNFLQGAYYEFHRDDQLCFPRNGASYNSFKFCIRCWVEY